MGPIEAEEFDATQYPPEYVTVGLDESIQSILERVEEGWVRSPNVVLIIPRGAQAFNNTHDFLALGKLPGARQVRVSIASPDPTIAGLARVLGFHIVDVPPDHPALTQDPTLGLPTEGDIEKPTSPLPLGMGTGSWGRSADWVLSEGKQPTPAPKRNGLTTSTWLANPEDYEPAAISKAERPKPKVQSPRTVVRSRQTSPLSSASLSSTPLADPDREDSAIRNPQSAFRIPPVSPTPSGRIKARSVMVPDETRIVERRLRYGGDLDGGFRWGRLFAVMLLLIVAASVGGSYYALNYLPEATIAVTPLQTSIAVPVELTVLLSDASGQFLAPQNANPPVSLVSSDSSSTLSAQITATLVKASITEEETRPATGSRQVPRGKAQGTMRFTNRLDTPVTVSTGMKFTAPNGVVVQTTQGGTIKATVFGQSFGTIDLPVVATVEGPDGNIAEGKIQGTYQGRFDYYNLALQGGSMETLKVVTQEDINALDAQVRSQAQAKVSGILRELVPPGGEQVLITQTVQVAELVSTPSHKANDDADSVSVKLTAEVRAYAYRESDVQEVVTRAAYDWVGTKLSSLAGPNLDPDSVKSDPLLIQSFAPGEEKVVYATSARGQVTYTLTPDLARQIRDLVKGKDVKQARNLITQQYGSYVNPLSIQAKVLWLTVDKLPTDPARIAVELSTAPGFYAPGGSPPPTQGPDPRSSNKP